MAEYFGKNYKRLFDYVSGLKKKYDNAVEVVPKINQILKKLNDELQKIEPVRLENEKQMEDKKTELSKKHYQKA
jgi:cell shape-determining protein MreC